MNINRKVSQRIDEHLRQEYMTVPMVVEYTKISKSTIYHLVSENRIPHLKIMGKNRFVRKQIDEWMLSHQVKDEFKLKIRC